MRPQHWFSIILILTKPVLGQDWREWSPRAEIAPLASKDTNTGELRLEGGGNPAVFGGWERTFPAIVPGQWYRFQARYRASGLTYEPLQVPVRLDWLDDAGRRTAQPEYIWRVSEEGFWRAVSGEAPAPVHAAQVKVQLLLQNAPAAVVRWKDVSLTPVPPSPPRTVAVAAIRYYPKNAPDPVGRFIEVVRTRLTQPADIILLPEGITVAGTGRTYADVAEPVPGPSTERLGALAREKKAWLVAGIYEREGKVVYNTAVLLDRAGKLAGKYRKVYLPFTELEAGLTPGSEYPVFQTDFGRVGLMICWDVQYADPARALALRGAELILLPIWGGNEALAKARAIENHVFLVSSGYNFPSLIFDPEGRTLARSEEQGTVVNAVIDLNRRYFHPGLGEMRARFFRELRGDVAADPPGRK